MGKTVRVARTGTAFVPFDEADYERFVDVKPRFDGVAAFLESRGIDLRRAHSKTVLTC